MAPATHQPTGVGNYAPVSDETTITGLSVEGTIPPALAGRYIRIGPNPIGTSPRHEDWAEGDGMVHAVTMYAGRAIGYRNRWIKTDIASAKLGTEPIAGPAPPRSDASNTNIIRHGRRILTLSDGALPYELTPDLDTVRRVDFGPDVRGVSDRPKTDPFTGELHVLSTPGHPQSLYRLAPEEATLSRVVHLNAHDHVHDFAITRTRLLLVGDSHIGVARRDAADRAEELPAAVDREMVPVSAFDDGRTLTAYLAGPSLLQLTVELRSNRLRQEVLDASPQTFARVNDQTPNGRHRYLYAIASGENMPFDCTVLYKHDLATGDRHSHDFGPTRHPGEFLFVNDVDRRGEDGGWLLGLVHGDDADRGLLMILDAQNVGSPALAAVRIPRRIPYGFHGVWIPT